VLICWTCGGAVAFGDHGWFHIEPAAGCLRLIVAWPPPALWDDDPNDG
jgi:hypothetical protein